LTSAKLAQGEFTLQHKRRPLILLRVQDVRYWHEAGDPRFADDVSFWHEADQLDGPLLRQQLTQSGH
jgi:hypothetical protein